MLLQKVSHSNGASKQSDSLLGVSPSCASCSALESRRWTSAGRSGGAGCCGRSRATDVIVGCDCAALPIRQGSRVDHKA